MRRALVVCALVLVIGVASILTVRRNVATASGRPLLAVGAPTRPPHLTRAQVIQDLKDQGFTLFAHASNVIVQYGSCVPKFNARAPAGNYWAVTLTGLYDTDGGGLLTAPSANRRTNPRYSRITVIVSDATGRGIEDAEGG